jgi:DnaJ-class molecular chaperone
MSNNYQNVTANDPYRVLGVTACATLEEIREKYLELVRQYPPDRDPSRFAEIRGAFDELNNPVESLRKQLFRTNSVDSIDAIIADMQSNLRHQRIPTETLLGLAKTN